MVLGIQKMYQALEMIRGILGKIQSLVSVWGTSSLRQPWFARPKTVWSHQTYSHNTSALEKMGTGQNRWLYAVSREVTSIIRRINDKSVEGVRHRYLQVSLYNSADAAPGPHDAVIYLTRFIGMMEAFKQTD